MTERIRTAVRVEGIVQGVGFRPFVYSLATSLGLGGLVGNDTGGVFAEVEGDAAAVRRFLVLLEQHAPPLARIERVTTSDLKLTGSAEFTIAPSDPAEAGPGARRNLISADTATCADCLAELADPADRRYRYPFINCTNCGSRFTIVRDVPYDRPLTTMSVRDVRPVRRRVPRPRRSPVPRPAGLLPGVRPAAVPARRGRPPSFRNSLRVLAAENGHPNFPLQPPE